MVIRKDLLDPNISEEDKKDIARVLDNYMANDEWAVKALKPVGVLLTSHPGNRTYLKASVETHKELGYWITLAYDNYLDPKRPNTTPNDVLPSREVMDMIDCFIMPHYQTWGGVLYPYFWLLKFGLSAMTQFEYIYCSNGDCILEKPENFPILMERLGDADFMSCGWEQINTPRPHCNTTAFIAKTEAAIKIIKHFQDHLIPFENYEKYTLEIGNAEGRFGRAVIDLNLQVVGTEPGWNTQFHKPGYGTWYDILGFRHIHAEFGYAYRHRLIPPEPKYFDTNYMQKKEYDVIKTYWETGDESILENWWKLT